MVVTLIFWALIINFATHWLFSACCVGIRYFVTDCLLDVTNTWRKTYQRIRWGIRLEFNLNIPWMRLQISSITSYWSTSFGYDLVTSFMKFLGGLSLHLNHLIQSRMEISYRLFGTLPIGLLLSNLDSRQLETSPMTSYDQF